MYHPLRIFLVGKYNYLVQEMGGLMYCPPKKMEVLKIRFDVKEFGIAPNSLPIKIFLLISPTFWGQYIIGADYLTF